ncbi:hypothetical protein L207DRAFT_251916 [Hyaloscypha variabilis F]|uniref:Uncharacterized protein n=1 Tax=Hyaloscypha variabilis (strain UAMH 11265 / GT02V1 / F) TaxID=1149755 RepID=A0A2J6S3E6_HYAVF|nr:hypothetical protein L207DRAFT_251916 [Hyaloscypha variabilis F]
MIKSSEAPRQLYSLSCNTRASQVYTRFRRASKTLYIVRKLERTHLILGTGWQSVLLAFIPFIRGIESY